MANTNKYNMNDQETTLKQLKELVEKFRSERNWGKHHTPKNLASSIAIEAAELMELYQWDDYGRSDRDTDVGQELADIVIYCLFFAVSHDIDLSEAIERKIDKSAKKYPVEKFNSGQDDPEDYWAIKRKHRADG